MTHYLMTKILYQLQDGELIQNIEDEQIDVPVQAPINTPIKKG